MHLVVPNKPQGISKADLKQAWDREVQSVCAEAIQLFREQNFRYPDAAEIAAIAAEVIRNLKEQDVDLTILNA